MNQDRSKRDTAEPGRTPGTAEGTPEDVAGSFAAQGQTSDDPALRTGQAGKTKSQAQPGRTPGQAEGPPDIAT
jgi:hypothetical protein